MLQPLQPCLIIVICSLLVQVNGYVQLSVRKLSWSLSGAKRLSRDVGKIPVYFNSGSAHRHNMLNNSCRETPLEIFLISHGVTKYKLSRGHLSWMSTWTVSSWLSITMCCLHPVQKVMINLFSISWSTSKGLDFQKLTTSLGLSHCLHLRFESRMLTIW